MGSQKENSSRFYRRQKEFSDHRTTNKRLRNNFAIKSVGRHPY